MERTTERTDDLSRYSDAEIARGLDRIAEAMNSVGREMLHKWASALDDGGRRILDFIEWLSANGYTICYFEQRDGDFYPVRKQPNQLVESFYEIDADQLERERRQLLEDQRAMNAQGGVQ